MHEGGHAYAYSTGHAAGSLMQEKHSLEWENALCTNRPRVCHEQHFRHDGSLMPPRLRVRYRPETGQSRDGTGRTRRPGGGPGPAETERLRLGWQGSRLCPGRGLPDRPDLHDLVVARRTTTDLRVAVSGRRTCCAVSPGLYVFRSEPRSNRLF